MRSELAVISCDVIRYCRAGFAKIRVAIIRYPLCFQASEEPFHWAVIPAISPATQALLYLISPQ
jgi:Mg2+/citrate symporter